MKLSGLRSAADIHEQDMRGPEYAREYERIRLASDVAVRVLTYRTQHGLSQTDLARKLGMRQPNIARLESGEHEPSLSTLARLSSVLGVDFSVDITPGGACLAAPRTTTPSRRRARPSTARSGAASPAPLAVVMKDRMAASSGRDQKKTRLRDLERLHDLISPYTPNRAAPIDRAVGRMPRAEQAEALDILARIGTLSEDPEKTAAREQILLDIARAETVLHEVLTRPHYKIRRGKVVIDPTTGKPVPDRKTEREARALLADMERLRGGLMGLPSADAPTSGIRD